MAQMHLELAAGAVVAERYRLDRLLGEGGMGAVWSATHVVTRKPVALKFLKGATAARPEARRRFFREARAASAVRHPNVVDIHDVLELEDGVPVMVMDLLRGESLASKLKRVHKLTVEETAAVLLPVLSAVGTAHALGIVHRDLKPDNVFLEDDESGGVVVKVLDFGIAKLTAAEGDAAETGAITGTGSMLGTPYYMSPEQAFGERDVDHRTDIWALGVIAYECLAGRRPIDGENFGQIMKAIATGKIVPIGEVVPELPRRIVDLVTRMLCSRREERPSDLRVVRDVLSSFSDVASRPFGAPQFKNHETQGSDVASGTRPETRVIVGSGAADPDAPTAEGVHGLTPPSQTSSPHSLPPSRVERRSQLSWVAGAGGVAVLGAALFLMPRKGRSNREDPGESAGAPSITAERPTAPRPSPAPHADVSPAEEMSAAPDPKPTATPSTGPSAIAVAKRPVALAKRPKPKAPPTPAVSAGAPAAAPNAGKGGLLEKPLF